MKKTILLIILIFSFVIQNPKAGIHSIDENLVNRILVNLEVDTLINNMSVDEKIGQLMMVAGFSNKGEKHEDELKKFITNHHIGGIIFFKGTPTKQAILTNEYQKLSTTPLFIAMDAEWGLAMRLDSIVTFPRQMTLGCIQNNDLIYKMAKEIAFQCNTLGVNINFAPVVDVNNNMNNPVIHWRSFG